MDDRSLISKVLVESLDAAQIDRDVARCTWHLLTGSQRSRRVQYQNKHKKKVANILRKKQQRLANLINYTLVQSYAIAPTDVERLRYYQGYHDVACIFLSTLGGGNIGPGMEPPTTPTGASIRAIAMISTPSEGGGYPTTIGTGMSSGNAPVPLDQMVIAMGLDLPSRVLCQVSHSHFRDAMRSDFLALQTGLKIIFMPLLHQLDPYVHAHLFDCDMEPYFCLSWIITWFAHDVRDSDVVKRLFDAFLVSHPLLPVYMSVAMLLHPTNRQWILQTDCDFASLHQCLASLPRNSCRVGWKARKHGDGYMSDDDDDHHHHHDHSQPRGGEEEEDRTVSTDLSNEFSRDDSGLLQGDLDQFPLNHEDHSKDDDNDNDNDTASTASGVSRNSFGPPSLMPSIGPIGTLHDHEQKVPFQVLLDMALSYMRRFPPRSLMGLSKRYYQYLQRQQQKLYPSSAGPSAHTIFPTDTLEDISLLQSPPSWALAATAKSDWVLKQRAREMMGLKATSRKDRRKKAQLTTTTTTSNMTSSKNQSNNATNMTAGKDEPTLLVDEQYLKKQNKSRAVIASGFGPGEEEEQRQRHRKRMMMMAVAVGLTAIAIAYIMNSNHSQSNSDKSCPQSNHQETSRPLLGAEATPTVSAKVSTNSMATPLVEEIKNSISGINDVAAANSSMAKLAANASGGVSVLPTVSSSNNLPLNGSLLDVVSASAVQEAATNETMGTINSASMTFSEREAEGTRADAILEVKATDMNNVTTGSPQEPPTYANFSNTEASIQATTATAKSLPASATSPSDTCNSYTTDPPPTVNSTVTARATTTIKMPYGLSRTLPKSGTVIPKFLHGLQVQWERDIVQPLRRLGVLNIMEKEIGKLIMVGKQGRHQLLLFTSRFEGDSNLLLTFKNFPKSINFGNPEAWKLCRSYIQNALNVLRNHLQDASYHHRV